MSILYGPNTFAEPLPHHKASGHRYSLIKALRQAADPASKRKPNGGLDGIEREVSDEIARRSDRSPRGFFVPLDVAVAPGLGRRDLTTSSGAGAIPTNTDAVQLIDALRSRLVCARLGARTTILGSGNGSVPRIGTGSAASWVSEGAAPASGSPMISGVPFTPRTVAGLVDISRTLLKSSPSAESIVVGDLASAIAHQVDRAAINGDGVFEPLGLAKAPEVATYGLGPDGNALSRADLIELEKLVADADGDAAADASMAFVTTPAGRAKLRSTEAVATSGRFLWDDDDRVLGKPAAATTALPSDLAKGAGTGLSALVYGNFADLQIGQWGAVDLLVDPYMFSMAGYVRINAYTDFDVKSRHPESFRKVLDFLTS